MSDDNPRQEAATPPDLSRPVATSDDSDYSLSIEEALARYEAASIPRTPRSIQRYYAKGHLEAHRIETPFGEKFLIRPESVDRHIAYIQEVRPVATGRGMPRQVATKGPREDAGEAPPEEAATSGDSQRQAATAHDVSHPVAAATEAMSRYVARLEGENEFLRGQISVKDEQIKDMTERARETNLLIGGLQKLLTPLLGRAGGSRHDEAVHTHASDEDGG